jgi:uncharacterized protein (DUF2237 family)
VGVCWQVRWLAPLRLALGDGAGHLLAALPPPRQFRGATALTYTLTSSRCQEAAHAGLCAAAAAAAQHMLSLKRVTLRTCPFIMDG